MAPVPSCSSAPDSNVPSPPDEAGPVSLLPSVNATKKDQPAAKPEAKTEPPAADTDDSADAKMAAPSFAWPLQGSVLTRFGATGEGGVRSDGLAIGAPRGAPVQASMSGTVVYASSDLKGFGNLVLIRHEGGWVSAYAHLDRLLVQKDAIVSTGDIIGTVGNSGTGIKTPQLHFEIRKGTTPVDPAPLLPKS